MPFFPERPAERPVQLDVTRLRRRGAPRVHPGHAGVLQDRGASRGLRPGGAAFCHRAAAEGVLGGDRDAHLIRPNRYVDVDSVDNELVSCIVL